MPATYTSLDDAGGVGFLGGTGATVLLLLLHEAMA
jgi:hypothetical protein